MTALKKDTRPTDPTQPTMGDEKIHRQLEQIWHAQSRRLLFTTWRITRNAEDAEDALQDTFLRALAHIGDFNGRSTLSTWLTRIAINSSLMILRKRRTRTAASLNDDEGDSGIRFSTDPTDHRPNPEEWAIRRDEEERVRHEIARLPALLAHPLEWHVLNERSVEETAESAGISVSATKSRLYRARTALRTSLEPRVARASSAGSRWHPARQRRKETMHGRS
ncbi:MAG TPA: sigma-70 family RNA polymerase sigma factor [Acidobacteriaceae bacterium]|jgi:RNA polymerase sigma-70 factor (ECF subfamily)|nr:sigma-70 family RNA polymerase sigma factor [Acidobacteriaceae bacterium]